MEELVYGLVFAVAFWVDFRNVLKNKDKKEIAVYLVLLLVSLVGFYVYMFDVGMPSILGS